MLLLALTAVATIAARLVLSPGATRNVAKLATAVITLREAHRVRCKQVVMAVASCLVSIFELVPIVIATVVVVVLDCQQMKKLEGCARLD